MQENTNHLVQVLYRGEGGVRVMRLGLRCKPRGSMMAGSSSNKKRPYGLLLLMALGAAVICVVVLQKLREQRVLGLLLDEQDKQQLTLQLLLQKEREKGAELKRNLEDMKPKVVSLRTEKMDLTNRLIEAEAITTNLKKKQSEIEVALEDKQIQINNLTGREAESIGANLQIESLTELLRQKEDEIEEMKLKLINLNSPEKKRAEDNITTDETATNNGKVDVPSEDTHLENHRNFSEGRESIEETQVGANNGKVDGTNSEKEDVPNDMQLENPSEATKGRASTEETQAGDSNEMAANHGVKTPLEGQGVKFKTDDEALKHENQNNADQKPKIQHFEKPEISQESEIKGDVDEKHQESITSKEVEKDSQYKNKGQVLIPAILKVTDKREDTKFRGQGSNGIKIKRRRRRARKGREPEKRNNGQLENSEIRDNGSIRGDNADSNTVKTNKMDTVSIDGQSEMQEKSSDFDGSKRGENTGSNIVQVISRNGQSEISQVPVVEEGLVTESGGDNKNAVESKEEAAFPDNGKSEVIANSVDPDVTMTNMKNAQRSQIKTEDDWVIKNGTENKKEKQEVSHLDASLSTQSQSNISGKTEATKSKTATDEQSQNTRSPEIHSSLQGHEGNGITRIGNDIEEKEVKSTETRLEIVKKAPDDESMNEGKGDVADMTKDQELTKETATINSTIDTEQSQISTNTEDQQNQPSRNTIKTVDKSIDGESQNEEKELTDDADNDNK